MTLTHRVDGEQVRHDGPRAVTEAVIRARLLRELDLGAEAGVILVAAGPGFGKTTLLTSWLSGLKPEVPVAWLTLGAHHNDPLRMSADLEDACARAGLVGLWGAHRGTGLARLATSPSRVPRGAPPQWWCWTTAIWSHRQQRGCPSGGHSRSNSPRVSAS